MTQLDWRDYPHLSMSQVLALARHIDDSLEDLRTQYLQLQGQHRRMGSELEEVKDAIIARCPYHRGQVVTIPGGPREWLITSINVDPGLGGLYFAYLRPIASSTGKPDRRASLRRTYLGQGVVVVRESL